MILSGSFYSSHELCDIRVPECCLPLCRPHFAVLSSSGRSNSSALLSVNGSGVSYELYAARGALSFDESQTSSQFNRLVELVAARTRRCSASVNGLYERSTAVCENSYVNYTRTEYMYCTSKCILYYADVSAPHEYEYIRDLILLLLVFF